MMAKAGYMPFDNEDRLEIFGGKRGGFDQQAGPGADDDWRGGGQQQHSPAGSGVSIAPAAASGLDTWPSTYSGEIGDAWTRQPEGGGKQGLRQVCACSGVLCGSVFVVADPLGCARSFRSLHAEEIQLFSLFFFMSAFACLLSLGVLLVCLSCHVCVCVCVFLVCQPLFLDGRGLSRCVL